LSSSKKTEKIVKVDLRGKDAKVFSAIKDFLGLEHDSEVLRYLIKHFSRQPTQPVQQLTPVAKEETAS
jgi:hypothetical protein